MPEGPQGELRPAGAIGDAVRFVQIATGEGTGEPAPPNPAAEPGRKGGAARTRDPTPERRREVARNGAAPRWSKPG